MLSAIVAVGPEVRDELEAGSSPSSALQAPSESGIPLACVEVLGRSIVARLVAGLRQAGVGPISIFPDATVAPLLHDIDSSVSTLFPGAENAWSSARQEMEAHKQNGVEATLVTHSAAYIEFDLADLLQFHREHAHAVTRVFDREGPLDMWVVDPARIGGSESLLTTLRETDCVEYFVRGYVNRLEHLRDLRRLVVDSLNSRCQLRPQGSEVRPGIWLDEGAQVHRDARIVAPAYIGRATKISAQCLITRCSNVESNCQIDYGTVVEDSSILLNSYVGIGLDLSHSIVDGSNLMNLERNVTLEIADPCVIRQNRILRKEKSRHSPVIFGFGGAQFAPAEEGSR